jgi:hypothetical protein
MRFTEPHGRMEEPSVPSRRSTRSSAPPLYTPRYSTYGFIILSEEEEKKLSRLEKRLVANVDFALIPPFPKQVLDRFIYPLYLCYLRSLVD